VLADAGAVEAVPQFAGHAAHANADGLCRAVTYVFAGLFGDTNLHAGAYCSDIENFYVFFWPLTALATAHVLHKSTHACFGPVAAA
jgi:hypothetical protein